MSTISEELNNNLNIYTPSSLLNTFNNTLINEEQFNQIYIKGIYKNQGNKSYRGYFYDKLFEETNEYKITLKVKDVIRQKLSEDNLYKFKGYLTKSVNDSGYIQIVFNVTELYSEEKRTLSNDDIKRNDILKEKTNIGFRDLDNTLKKKLYEDKKTSIALIYGNVAIVDEDIKQSMTDVINSYDIKEFRINLTDKNKIIELLNVLNSKGQFDVIALVRGGGSKLEVFNDLDIAVAALNINSIFVTAIGHASDNTFIDKVADKSFSTPTALGNYLKTIVNNVAEEKLNSKHKIIKKIEEQKDKEIKELRKNLQKEYELMLKEKLLEIRSKYKLSNEGKASNYIILVTIALIIGYFIGKYLF